MTARALLVVVLVILAGCAAPLGGDRPSGGSDGDPAARTPATATKTSAATPDPWTWPEDPPTDRLGWEGGYWYNESIAVDQTDGLNDTELRAFVNRTMARVEVLRGLEFTGSVPVEVQSRAAYRNSSAFDSGDDAEFNAWNDQVWEALLLVGEDREVAAVFDELYGGAVQGYYTSDDGGRIVVVSDAERPSIDRGTLAHELVHALQDQQFGLPAGGDTQDAQLARNGLVEGDAVLVERLYGQRCGAEWDCVANPAGGGGGSSSFDFGVYLTIYTPYSEGPTFVDHLHERGGWAAVNAAYDDVPVSTEQVLHPEAYPDERPATVSVPDRSAANWSRFDVDPEADTVGEASIFVMLWDNRGIDPDGLREDVGAYSAYNYVSKVSAGWAGDSVVPYRSDDGEFGYVFRTRWDTEADARAFERVYVDTVLQVRLRGEPVGANTYVVDSGPFADAFRVVREGDTVTVVNAPTVAQLDAVHRS